MKNSTLNNDFPFIKDKNHIFNILVEHDFPSVNIGWTTLEFELHANLTDGGDELFGITLFDQNKIKLDIAMNDKKAREIIVHEILHCFLENLGLDEENYDGKLFCATNESLVVGMTKQISTFNLLNPGLLSLVLDNSKPEPKKRKR